MLLDLQFIAVSSVVCQTQFTCRVYWTQIACKSENIKALESTAANNATGNEHNLSINIAGKVVGQGLFVLFK